jgi:hypothetical protein
MSFDEFYRSHQHHHECRTPTPKMICVEVGYAMFVGDSMGVSYDS